MIVIVTLGILFFLLCLYVGFEVNVVELIIMVAIISILAAITIPAYNNFVEIREANGDFTKETVGEERGPIKE